MVKQIPANIKWWILNITGSISCQFSNSSFVSAPPLHMFREFNAQLSVFSSLADHWYRKHRCKCPELPQVPHRGCEPVTAETHCTIRADTRLAFETRRIRMAPVKKCYRECTAKVKCYLRFFLSAITEPLTIISLKNSLSGKIFFFLMFTRVALSFWWAKVPTHTEQTHSWLTWGLAVLVPEVEDALPFAVKRAGLSWPGKLLPLQGPTAARGNFFGTCPWKAATPKRCLTALSIFVC